MVVFLAILHAILYALAWPPFDLWFVAMIAPLPLALVAIHARRTTVAVLITAVSQFFMWLWLLRWVVAITPLGYPAFALYMSVWPALMVWMIRRLSRHTAFSQWPMAIMLPVLWVGVEYFRGDVLFHGYPWYQLGHPMIAVPMLVQSADLFGTYFISFLSAMVAGLIVEHVHARRPGFAGGHSTVKRRMILTSLVACVLVCNGVYGYWRMNQSSVLTPGPRILAIQTSVPLDIKKAWSEAEQRTHLDQFIALTREALATTAPPPDLIVWPETMVPGVGFERQTIEKIQEMLDVHGWDLTRLSRGPQTVRTFQRGIAIPMLVGSETWLNTREFTEGTKIRIEPELTYNSAYLINGDLPHQRYDKCFLTPFGETMPYISEWPWLEQQFLNIGVSADMAFNLDSNPKLNLLEMTYRTHEDEAASVRIATPICFEDTVARFCRRLIHADTARSADLVVNLSNGGWFHVSDADRRMHAMTAQFRAIEHRIPMVRSVNTGMSMWVDSCGRIKKVVGDRRYGTARQTGWLVADVQLDARRTLYGRVGEIWPLGCMLASIIMVAFTFRQPRMSLVS